MQIAIDVAVFIVAFLLIGYSLKRLIKDAVDDAIGYRLDRISEALEGKKDLE